MEGEVAAADTVQGDLIDLDDPGNEIVDEDKLAEISADDNDSDDLTLRDNGTGESLLRHARKRRAQADAHNEENSDDYEDVGNSDGEVGDEEGVDDPNVEDLNEVPDCEPQRDDALTVFAAREAAPVHAIATHPKIPGVFVASGQSDEVYVLQLVGEGTLNVNCILREPHTDTISILAFSPDGSLLASGGLDGVIAIWSTATWELQHSLRELSGELLTLLWHPSGLVLVGGAEDGQAAMWNVKKGSLAMYFAGHSGSVACAAWTPCYKRLVTGGGDGNIAIFSPRTGQQEAYIAKGLSPDRAPVTALCCLGDINGVSATEEYDDRCVAGCADGTLHVVSLNTGRVVASMQEVHTQAIETLQTNMGADGVVASVPQLLLSSSCDCKVVVWSTVGLTPRTVIHVGESVVPAVWVRSSLVVAGCSDGEVKVWDGRSQQQEPLKRLMGHRRMVLSIAVAEELGIVASASDDGTVRLFRLAI
uniref:Uncharacterized protein TCIL3000_5_4640 n=1 Tax=Trypanosoma congolense (strain IL3000) TaxID=1068625 RepID=G0UM53_TRYCI|nr:unnamed protein product [Trypanosoma congolense IL3000]